MGKRVEGGIIHSNVKGGGFHEDSEVMKVALN